MSPKKTDTTTEETTEAKRDRSKELARATHYYADPDELTIIGLDTKDGPDHPLYDPRIHRPLEEARVRNFLFYGVMKPVEVRRNEGRLEVVDGRGRVRYARAAKQEQLKRGEDTLKVPVIIVKGDDSHLFGRSRAGNIHDADGPMTTAKNMQRQLAMGKTPQEVADTFGVSTQTVANYQTLLDAAPEVIEATIKEEISHTAAIHLAQLSKSEQAEVLADIKSEEKETGKRTTVDKVKRKVAEKQGKTVKTPKERIENAKKLLTVFAGKSAGEKTKEEMQTTLERLSRVLFSMGLDKLVATDEE